LVTATNDKTLDLKIFSAKETPDVEIALACKASASIPLAFEITEIDGQKYVDGGYRDNIPIKYFNQDNSNPEKEVENNKDVKDITGNKDAVKNAKKEGRILAFAFGATDNMENPINTAIYSSKEKIQEPSVLMQFFEKVVMKFVNFCKGRELEGVGKLKYSEAEESMYQGIREKNALGTIVLDTKKVGTLGFTEAMNNADYLATKGYIQTMNHMDNHYIGKIDPNLRKKEFMLSVYEKISFDRSMTTGFVDKLIGGKEAKLENVLYFCKKDAWVEVDGNTLDNKEVIKDFVTILAEKRSSSPKDKDNQKTTETKSMGEMIDLLNKKTTPSSVRNDFAKAIGIDLEKVEIKNYSFKKEDFANVVKNHTISKDFRAQTVGQGRQT
jgi:NTE family protein